MTAALLSISRQTGHLDNDLISQKRLIFVGVGRDVSRLEMLAGMGFNDFTIVDPGIVEPENVGQSGYLHSDVGEYKGDAASKRIFKANSKARVTVIKARHDEVPNLAELMQSADLTSDGADDLRVAKDLAALAWKTSSDVLHIRSSGNSRQFVIVGTLAKCGTPGCVRCRLKSAFDALEQGYQTPPFFPSFRLVPERLNIHAAWVTLGLLHERHGSDLPIAEVGSRFRKHPAWVGLNGIDAASGEIFPIKEYREQLPPNWACPVCGNEG